MQGDFQMSLINCSEVKSKSHAGCGCLTLIIVGLIIMIIISRPPLDKNTTYKWGQIKYVHTPTNIRSERSSKSKIVGGLQTNEKVKADFLKDNWYVVFKPEETIRDTLKALGYVYAPLLKQKPLKNEPSIKKSKSVEDKKETSAPKTQEEIRKEKLQEHFSLWDGSHNGLTAYIKKTMNDPNSYKHVETFYGDYSDYLIVKTTFRGKNVFGGVVTNTITAKVDLNGNVIEVTSWEP